jgi:Xaa-Pro aminopeptidase
MNNKHKKIGKLQELLEEHKLDCIAIGPTTNMRYLLGYSPHADERLCLLLIDSNRAQLIVPKVNCEAVAAHTDLEMLTWADERGPQEVLRKSMLHGKNIRTLAMDGSTRSDFLLPLLALLCPEQVVALDPVIAPLRMIKSNAEIEALTQAAALADLAMQAAVDACQPGVSEADIAWAAEECFRNNGAEKVEFTLIAAGSNAALPHHSSGSKVLKRGEGIILDIGASLKDYKSDITRTVFLGEPNKEFLRVYETVRSANESGKKAVQPNVTARSVDAAARQVIEQAGYGRWFIHRTGHGIGLDIHEPPWIMAGEEGRLEIGMVFSVEPGIYLPERFGVRLEDIVVVVSGGVRVLTRFNRQLVCK